MGIYDGNQLQRQELPTAILLVLALILPAGCGKTDTASVENAKPPVEVRLGYFPNVTHAQAVLSVASGDFASALAPSKLTTRLFNAGPALLEALFAGEIDLAYIGPGPVLTGNARTNGSGLRVVASAATNGVLIVARSGSGISKMEDLAGKRVATPQQGNTQDIAARHYLKFVLHQDDLSNVLPISNAEQGGMMARGQIDAAWAPEPWGSRLMAEAGATLVGQEKDLWPDKQFVLTLVVTTPEFLEKHADLVEKMLRVHHRWTVRLQRNPQQYIAPLEAALGELNGKPLPKGLIAESIKRVGFGDDPIESSLRTMGQWSFDLGFTRQAPDLGKLMDTTILRRISQEPVESAPATQLGQ